MRLRIGTRGSALARAQAADVARRLAAAGHETETIVITTAGDRVVDRAFEEIGSFGVFVREIEAALLDCRVDVAVHSYKDLPTTGPAGLVVAAVPERVDVADVLLAIPEGSDAAAPTLPLRGGARVGTSAARRQALLRWLRPDLDVRQLRGNVPTRVAALANGRFDAVVLAAAGLARLERVAPAGEPLVPAGVTRMRLDPDVFVPAPAQGAIAVQVRATDREVRAAVEPLDDPEASRALRAERAALALAEGGCNLPFGAWAQEMPGGALRLVVALGSSDGGVRRCEVAGDDPDHAAQAAWAELAGAGRRA